ncbi:mast cell protease 3-like [Cheilinus undulatus]|uniref:mast cell protease 3-like n=1 Tax=Cheilinus undulatus TaxID=241271 RepID=UPI001BD555A4|nr:mast cell protease 3-like [Cheilinus undulatus]
MHALYKIFIFSAVVGFGKKALGGEIINGEKTKESAMQYMASVQNDKGHICGGFLISEDFVLTAAHCDDKNPTHVVLGTHSLKDVDETKKYLVKRCKHGDFKSTRCGDDIMLLKLSRKAKLGGGTHIVRIKLPSHKIKLNKKKMCRVAGWGSRVTDGKDEDKLWDVKVPVIDYEECNKLWRNTLPEKVICAGGNNTKKGFCKGDSGGPLVCDDLAVGIVSFNNNEKCDYVNNIPNVYTDVSKYISWINKIMKKC